MADQQTIRKLRLDVQGRLTYGFSDPFVTGVVHGAVVVLPRLPQLSTCSRTLHKASLRGWAGFSLRLYPSAGIMVIASTGVSAGREILLVASDKGALRIIPKPTKEVVNP